jgi:hypothetical protein
MSVVLEKIISNTAANGVNPRLITTAEYDQMIEKGIYTKYDRMELLNGVFIELPKTTPIHASSASKVSCFFYEKLAEKVIIRHKNPIHLDEYSEPEPDIVLAKSQHKNYLENHPTPADILLIMEISDTTLAYDRDAKAGAYSRNGIQQYLLLNLQNETLEDYREPSADGYGAKRTYRSGDVFNLVAFPEIEIKFDDLF